MAFVVFEGLDHSGKSTLIQSLSRKLKAQGVKDLVLTREPGGTALGEQLRDVLLRVCPSKDSLSVETELLLISASRRDHIEKVIKPNLEMGNWVLCDRFWPSTSAFQGAGGGISSEQITWLKQFTVPKDITPNLFVLLDMPVAEKEKRSQTQGHLSDHFEMQNRAFHQRVRECYLSLAKEDPKKWLILNALLSPEELVDQVLQEFQNRNWIN